MSNSDKKRLQWLQDQITDTIYLDDGGIIDVRGGDIRRAIDDAMADRIRRARAKVSDEARKANGLP